MLMEAQASYFSALSAGFWAPAMLGATSISRWASREQVLHTCALAPRSRRETAACRGRSCVGLSLPGPCRWVARGTCCRDPEERGRSSEWRVWWF